VYTIGLQGSGVRGFIKTPRPVVKSAGRALYSWGWR
jgi:hypothetical protein